ncbi:MAG: hypothetical protein Rubg2KO_13550 [Rubricoccaceae bacterium]
MAANAWQCDLNWSANTAPGLTSTVQIGSETVTGVFSSSIVQGLELNGTTLNTLGSLQINQGFNWNGGFISTGGTLRIVGPATIAGPSQVNLQSTDLRIDGTGVLTWSGGQIAMDTDATIDNHGTFDVQQDGQSLIGFQFINRITGRITRTVGTGTATFNIVVTNEGGRIDVRTGTLGIDGAILQGGTYNADAGATLHFTSFLDFNTFSGVLSGDPAGSILLDNGLSEINLAGPTTFDFGGTGLEWQDSVLEGAGHTLTNTGLIVMPEFHQFNNGTLRNEGTILWEGAINQLDTFTLENAGLIDLLGTNTFLTGGFTAGQPNSQFINLDGGILRRSTNPGDVFFGLPTTNADGGIFDLLTGALVMGSNSSLDLQDGSRLQGIGTLRKGSSNGITFGGVIAPGTSPGVLAYAGDASFPFDPTATAVLEIEIGGPTPGTEHDQLAVTGPAELGGTLRVTLLDGFRPQENDRFQILASSSPTTGAFDAIELPDGITATVDVSATGAELVIGTVVSSEADGQTSTFALHPVSPNPVASNARLRFDLPEPGHVELAVFDALGRQLEVVLSADVAAGTHSATFDASVLPSGVYIVRLTAGAEVALQRLTVAR